MKLTLDIISHHKNGNRVIGTKSNLGGEERGVKVPTCPWGAQRRNDT